MDDDAMIREIGADMLEHLGHQVVLAEEGQQAVDLYQQALLSNSPIDLVIMDLTILDGLGGKETIALLKETDPTVKALVSSGYSNDDVMANYKQYGFAGAVGKPYTREELKNAILSAL